MELRFDSVLTEPYRCPYDESGDPFGYNECLPTLRAALAVALLGRFISPDAHRCIVDVGCGEGYITRAVAHAFPLSSVWGVDRCEQALNRAYDAARNNLLDRVQERIAHARPLLVGDGADAATEAATTTA